MLTNMLQEHIRELEVYELALQQFSLMEKKDVRRGNLSCSSLRVHPDGLEGIFLSKTLSMTPAGYIEPLLPPMRHPKFCGGNRRYLMSMAYLVHDFERMCQNMKSTSKIVLLDLGASLSFHKGTGDQPIVTLISLYEKFGFHFDHIYAFEKTFSPPEEIYRVLPESLLSSYHWINNGVEADMDSKLNPWNLLKQFNVDNLIVVKLDVDTPAVELPLVQQLLDHEELFSLVDQFYFEHHVELQELKSDWGKAVEGSVASSLRMFRELRDRGMAAHFWV